MLGSHGEGVKDLKPGKLDNSLFFEQVELPYVCVCVCNLCICRYVCLPWPMFSCVKGQFNYLLPGFSSVQSLSPVRLFETPWIVAHQASLSITNSQRPLKLMPIESVMLSNHLILCRPLLLLPSIFPSIRGLFKWVSSSHQVAKILELQLQHQSFQWIFRTDFL